MMTLCHVHKRSRLPFEHLEMGEEQSMERGGAQV